MHQTISPAILYFGTPVVLLTTINPDNTTANIAPNSSCWWLGNRAMLGISAASQTGLNLLRTGQCVLNLPSSSMASAINALAKTTGITNVPDFRTAMGYTHVKDKFSHAGLTPQPSDLVAPPRIQECPVQMEVELVVAHPLMQDSRVEGKAGFVVAVELKVLRVHIEDELRMEGYVNRVDPKKWRPMIMTFQELYGLSEEQAGRSRLAEIGEEGYRMLVEEA